MSIINFYLVNSDKRGTLLEWIITSPPPLLSSNNFPHYFKNILFLFYRDQINQRVLPLLLKIIKEKSDFQDSIIKEDQYLLSILKMIKAIIKSNQEDINKMNFQLEIELFISSYLFPSNINLAFCQHKKTRNKVLSILMILLKVEKRIPLNALEVN